ncbi:hypothetical protein BOO86_13695 [Mycobacterium sp. CBMA 234]|uniref:hypothetical protein n=1 Tax=Mycolicibacterium sp. CBMA 234 TaxID=1918495 RepID=UPI0012DCFB18|nr:hypothetical protein [Mycolicibacterium sp. CBMA 234]MUL65527.1 hypothetical protein [Mycolicibacterium sp. CBMA 234]
MVAALYDDGNLTLDDDGLTIRRYYFPLGTEKRVPYVAIRGIDVRPLGAATGSWRLWGTGSPSHWFPLDMHRPKKDTLVVIDTGAKVKPCITPAEPQRFVETLRARIG